MNNLRDFQKKENLFNNFDEFVKNCNLNDLGFDINEKNPSNFSNVLAGNILEKDKSESTVSQITYSPDYFKIIKESFEINIESKHKPITYSLPREQREARDTSNNYSNLNKNNKKNNKENNKNASSNMTDDQIFSESLKSLKTSNSGEKEGKEHSMNNGKDNNSQRGSKNYKDKNWKGSNYNNQKNNNNSNLEKRNSGQNQKEKYQEETFTEEYYNDNTTSNYSNYEGNYNKTYKNGNGGGYYSGGGKKKSNNYKY